MGQLLVIANIGCLAGALWGAWRLWQSMARDGGQASFAAHLFTAQAAPRSEDAAPCPVPPPRETRGAPEPDRAADEQEIRDLGVADRLTILRNMLQGRSVAETASTTAVPAARVEAMYRLHGRHGG